MNLHYRPIVIFEGNDPYVSSYLNGINWSIDADPIGHHEFSINGYFVPHDPNKGLSYIEFDLVKSDVKFEHDDYPCKLAFRATVDSPLSSPMLIEYEAYGFVKVRCRNA